jgi:hypothetical protein
MSHSAEMINQLQPFQRKSLIYKALFDTEGIQFENGDAAITDLNLQLSVDTATWALAIYETELGIDVIPSKPDSERRSVIKSKMRGTGKVDAALIKLVADSYSYGNVTVSFDGTIKITFVSLHGVPENLGDIEKAISDIIPAHLAFAFFFTYMTWSSLDEHGFTWGSLSALNYTWDQFEKIT